MENLLFLGVPILKHIRVYTKKYVAIRRAFPFKNKKISIFRDGVGSHNAIGVRGCMGITKILKFYVEVFDVMGKVLSGELSRAGTGLVFHCSLLML